MWSTFPINFAPSDKVTDRSKLKAFADDKMNVTDIMNIGLGKLENIVEIEKILAPFPQCFQKPSSPGVCNPLPHNIAF